MVKVPLNLKMCVCYLCVFRFDCLMTQTVDANRDRGTEGFLKSLHELCVTAAAAPTVHHVEKRAKLN